MKIYSTLLTICSVLLLMFGAGVAQDSGCIRHVALGIEIPASHSGICLFGDGSPRGIAQLTDQGLLLLFPQTDEAAFPPLREGDVLSLEASEVEIVFCPGEADEIISGTMLESCIDDIASIVAGPAAFAGRGQMLLNGRIAARGVLECPLSAHVRGLVRGPAGGEFEIASSLVAFHGNGACKNLEGKVNLSYLLPGTEATYFAPQMAATPAAGLRPGRAPVRNVTTAFGTVAQEAGAGLSCPSNQGTGGIPAVLDQLAALRATQLQMEAMQLQMQMTQSQMRHLQLETDSNTANRPFEVDAQWCFEAAATLQVKGESETTGTFEGAGKGGADIYGSGFQGKLQFGKKKRFGREFAAEGAFPKLVVCIKGPVIKRLEDVLDEAQLALLEALASSQGSLRDRLPEVVNTFNVSGQNLEAVLNFAQAESFDLSNPLESLANLADLLGALPLNANTRSGLQSATGFLDGLSLDTLKICDREDLPSFLTDLCSLTEGSDLAGSISAIKEIVIDIAGTVGVDSCRRECRQTRDSCEQACDAGPLKGRRQCKNKCADEKDMCIAGCS